MSILHRVNKAFGACLIEYHHCHSLLTLKALHALNNTQYSGKWELEGSHWSHLCLFNFSFLTEALSSVKRSISESVFHKEPRFPRDDGWWFLRYEFIAVVYLVLHFSHEVLNLSQKQWNSRGARGEINQLDILNQTLSRLIVNFI